MLFTDVPALLFVLLFSDSAGNPRRFCFVLLLPFRVRAKNREFAFLCSAVAAAASLLPLAATQYEILNKFGVRRRETIKAQLQYSGHPLAARLILNKARCLH